MKHLVPPIPHCLARLLALLILALAAPNLLAVVNWVDGYAWGEDGNSYQIALNESTKTASITKLDELVNTSVVVPESVAVAQWNEKLEEYVHDAGSIYTVTEIVRYAFSNLSDIKSITLPSTLQSIGESAFLRCSGLTEITLPASLKSIGFDCFEQCSNIRSIEVDASNEYYSSINGVLFDKTAETLVLCPPGKKGKISLSETVKTIGSNALKDCIGVTSIKIPSSVTKIGFSAFRGCSGLTEIVIPPSVTEIIDNTFYNCSGLISVVIPNSIIYIGRRAFYGCKALKTANIPTSLERIFEEAFSGCSQLESLELPNSIIEIGNNAFTDCTGFKSIVLPSAVLSYIDSTQIKEYTGFGYYKTITGFERVGFSKSCPNLENVILGDVITDCEPIVNMTGFNVIDASIKKLTIGNIVKTPPYIPSNFPELKELIIGKGSWLTQRGILEMPKVEKIYSLQRLGNHKLSSAVMLKSLTVPLPGFGSADAVGNFGQLFGENKYGNVTQYFEDGTTKTYSIPTTLEELTILEGCGMIPYGGLSNCNMLKKLTLPSTIYMVGEKALYGCAQLSDIYCMGAEPAVAYDNSFDGMRLTSCKLHVPYNSGDMYKEAEGWKRFRYIQEEAPIVISVTKNIENAGVVFGLEEYRTGQTAELRAVANSGYTFEGWYEGETLLTAEGTYAFTVLGNRELVAVFAPVADSNPVSVDAPGETATFMWPAVEGAASYTVTAYSDEAMTVPVVTVSLDASDNPVESRADGDMSATLSGLSKETRYYYSISAFNANGGMLSRYTGAFTTGTAAIGEVSGDAASPVPAAYYNSQGIRSSVPWRGLNVVIYTDGSRRKLLID